MSLAFPRKHLRPALLALLAYVMAGPFQAPAWAGQEVSSQPSESDRLHQVQRQIESHQGKIEETQIQALNLEQEIKRITSQINKGQDTLRDLEVKLRNQEKRIRKKEAEIASMQAAKETTSGHVKKRLAAFYQTGEVGIINALFSATNLGDLVNLQEYVQALFLYDQQVLQGFRDQLALLAKAKDDLTRAKKELQSLIAQVREGEKALLKSREERDKLLAQVRAEEQLYRQALKELKTAATKLTKAINRARQLEIKASKQKTTRRQAGASTGFETRQGRIPPPAKGRIIRGFGPYKDRFGNNLQAAGVDLDVPPATTVKAMHDGRIIFSDQIRGYGKLVIIDHGSQYYSLVSGLESLAKKQNDEVSAGEPIGTFGQPTGLVNPGLHIEIRHGASPVDPLLWLDRSQLEE